MTHQIDQRRHNFSNVLFTAQTAATATIMADLLLTSCSTGVTSIVTSGYYVVDFVKTDDRWLIEHIRAGFDNSF